MTQTDEDRHVRYVPGMPRKTAGLILFFNSLILTVFIIVVLLEILRSDDKTPFAAGMMSLVVFCTLVLRLSISTKKRFWRRWFLGSLISVGIGAVISVILFFLPYYNLDDAFNNLVFITVASWLLLMLFMFFPRRRYALKAHQFNSVQVELQSLVLCPGCNADLSFTEELVCDNCGQEFFLSELIALINQPLESEQSHSGESFDESK